MSEWECRRQCGEHEKIYVAVSEGLNSVEASKNQPWHGNYVIKIGSSKACRQRERFLKRDHKDERCYAGVRDWRIIECWDSVVKEQDELFRPWARIHIKYIDTWSDSNGIERQDLYYLSPQQVALSVWPSTGDCQNDDIVQAAIKDLRLLILAGKVPNYMLQAA